jgi:hypothetical protein
MVVARDWGGNDAIHGAGHRQLAPNDKMQQNPEC